MSKDGFVSSTIDFASILSPAALAALKELALDRGVIDQHASDSDEEDSKAPTSLEEMMGGLKNHFQATKIGAKEQIFHMQFGTISFAVKGVKQNFGQTLDSTGLTIWRAAENLCEFLMKNPAIMKDRHICELGGGLGVVSILVHKTGLASSVVCTDGDDISLELLRENAEDTDCLEQGMLVEKLYWGEHEKFLAEHPLVDFILAADVVYEEEQIEPLLATSVAILKQADAKQRSFSNDTEARMKPEMLLAYCRRNVPIDRVYATAERMGLQHEVINGDVEPIVRLTLK
jgi:hypothetical protein